MCAHLQKVPKPYSLLKWRGKQYFYHLALNQSLLDSYSHDEIDAHNVTNQDLKFIIHRLLIMFTLIID